MGVYSAYERSYTFADYANAARKTSGDDSLQVLVLGLCGEAGEVADHVKKFIGHGHPLDKGAMEKELGDVLWYLEAICRNLGISLAEVAQKNISKLAARYPDGFSTERSLHRTV